jgi:hypothetical protein
VISDASLICRWQRPRLRHRRPALAPSAPPPESPRCCLSGSPAPPAAAVSPHRRPGSGAAQLVAVRREPPPPSGAHRSPSPQRLCLPQSAASAVHLRCSPAVETGVAWWCRRSRPSPAERPSLAEREPVDADCCLPSPNDLHDWTRGFKPQMGNGLVRCG